MIWIKYMCLFCRILLVMIFPFVSQISYLLILICSPSEHITPKLSAHCMLCYKSGQSSSSLFQCIFTTACLTIIIMGLWYVFLSGESGMRLWFQRVILTVLLFLRAGFCLMPPQTRPGPLLCTQLTLSETHSDSQFVMSANPCCPRLGY